MRSNPHATWATTLLGIALVFAATMLILNGLDGAATTVLYAAAAAAFGASATTFLPRK